MISVFLPKVKKKKKCARRFGMANIMDTVNSNFYLLTTFCEILTHSFLFTFRNYKRLTTEQAWLQGPSLMDTLFNYFCVVFFYMYISYPTFLCKPVSRIKLRIRVDCKSGSITRRLCGCFFRVCKQFITCKLSLLLCFHIFYVHTQGHLTQLFPTSPNPIVNLDFHV